MAVGETWFSPEGTGHRVVKVGMRSVGIEPPYGGWSTIDRDVLREWRRHRATAPPTPILREAA